MDLKASQKIFNQLEAQITEAKKLNKPFDSYVKQQIKLLEKVHDDFVSSSTKKDKDVIYNLDFVNVQIKQLQAISSLCRKIGLPTDKYDNKIREIRINNLGAEFVKERYGG